MAKSTDDPFAPLAQYGFDPQLFEQWQHAVAKGSLSKANNVVQGELLPPPSQSIKKLPSSDSDEWLELEQIGAAALSRGEFGVVILNGGMATRFGGVVKGTVDVLDERSFLALAMQDIQRAERVYGNRIHVFLMNSFATDEATKQHFAEHDNFGVDPAQIHHFTQFVSVRMDTKGGVLRLKNGDVSPYGPGHGDFPPAFRSSGELRRFLDGGGKYLLVRNVDNLGARVDPIILGHHIASQAAVTVELAPKWPEDTGGSPYLFEGRTQLIEQLRYPKGFDPDIVDVFNSNTFTFSASALDRDFDLTWYYVEKKVEERKAVQIEHLVGEVTRELETNFLRVRRSGTDSRFLPVKTPEDLDSAREEIAEMYDGTSSTQD